MDFIDKIGELASRLPKQIEYCTTEEATKNALVLPFIQALGYDVFNPAEVMPEMTADFGTKKGEKVDYAILKDDKPIIIFECKRAGVNLADVHASQLYRYFSVLSEVRFGVLTNGVDYQFYSDLDALNRMDDRPFFVFNMLDYQDRHVTELKKFTKSSFDLDEIRETASELKYTAAIKQIVAQEFDQPSPEFVAFLTRQVYSGKVTKSVREQFEPITRKALRRYLNDQISERLESALEATRQSETAAATSEAEPVEADIEEVEGVVRADQKRGIVTTEDEIEGYFAVKSLLRDVIDIRRVHMRDLKTYCNILLDDSNRKPICRLHFNQPQKYLGIFDENKQEQRIAIGDIDEVYEHNERIIATVRRYDSAMGAPVPPTTEREVQLLGKDDSYTGKKVQSFVIQGERHAVSSWRDVLMAVLGLMRDHDRTAFEHVAPTLVGRKRPYITPNQSELRAPQLIPQTNLYVETNLSSQMIVGICYSLIEQMGSDLTDLAFEVYH